MSQKPVIFFDGVCGLCNHVVDFLLTRDGKDQFLYAPLQGPTARTLLPEAFQGELRSLVLWDNGNTFRKSEAVFQILSRLGGLWGWLSLFRFLPLRIRDGLYDFIAQNRYRWFGKNETCRFPTRSEKLKFLD